MVRRVEMLRSRPLLGRRRRHLQSASNSSESDIAARSVSTSTSCESIELPKLPPSPICSQHRRVASITRRPTISTTTSSSSSTATTSRSSSPPPSSSMSVSSVSSYSSTASISASSASLGRRRFARCGCGSGVRSSRCRCTAPSSRISESHVRSRKNSYMKHLSPESFISEEQRRRVDTRNVSLPEYAAMELPDLAFLFRSFLPFSSSSSYIRTLPNEQRDTSSTSVSTSVSAPLLRVPTYSKPPRSPSTPSSSSEFSLSSPCRRQRTAAAGLNTRTKGSRSLSAPHIHIEDQNNLNFNACVHTPVADHDCSIPSPSVSKLSEHKEITEDVSSHGAHRLTTAVQSRQLPDPGRFDASGDQRHPSCRGILLLPRLRIFFSSFINRSRLLVNNVIHDRRL